MEEPKLICYVASPVKNILELENYTPKAWQRVMDMAESGCREVKERGYIPLSPVLLFAKVYCEEKQREEALKDGLALLAKCHCFYEVKSAYKSEGVAKEREVAIDLGLALLN
ncbi:hypothetical protein BBW65_07105 [Helicobacter enhydrae]|uniref:DUF7768 domain-containing protein n=1 Tax=Helicobacter enhydrae TaxID=222136 RepID=A0A1B1U6D8_9HELI|nr:hypothetical protein [Helicobacter enhydrae]ANV98306.1 hypothetical protein BBW65_05610 [Helicobacter enhydrae]ANV98576.1 hypothetical protein BBW65_07105 [Helicobacter enhydrae]